ncbi:MAG: hypothetical protein IT581_12245 [Verrucomicrobiales bacterium]|nr:hypothetical protein [Verrucomicrobiales bacterium]
MKTRPCRVGDELARLEMPCGAWYRVTVFEPEAHPASGTTADKDVKVRLEVVVPSRSKTNNVTRDDLRGPHKVLGEEMDSDWGVPYSGFGNRSRAMIYTGASIPTLVAEAVADGNAATTLVQEIADRHAASRVAQEQARNRAYSEWLVPSTDSEPTAG